jgi:hypothetical protein
MISSFYNLLLLNSYRQHIQFECQPQHSTQENIYGTGQVRTPETFYETFGIDVVKKTTVDHLCRFVEGGKMHHQFMPNLRSDGMGIDYRRITYKHTG